MPSSHRLRHFKDQIDLSDFFFVQKYKILKNTFINVIFCLLSFEAFYLLELGSNDNFLHKAHIGSILNSGQRNLVLNVESEN